MERKYQTVVEGEASESEEEEEIETKSSVVVEGEAEETDEEEIDTSEGIRRKDIPPLKVNDRNSSYETLDDIGVVPVFSFKKHANKPKHDTILNRKLWDSNLSLCSSINGSVSHTYLQAAKDITNCSHQVSKSHSLIQDVSHNMRLMTNDLFNLHDRIDIITSCTILPAITIKQKAQDSAAERPETPPASVAQDQDI